MTEVRVCTESLIVENASLKICKPVFETLKVWKIEVKTQKMGKKKSLFLFSITELAVLEISYNLSALFMISGHSMVVCTSSWESWFLHFSRSFLSCYCFGKSLEFWKIIHKPFETISPHCWTHHGLGQCQTSNPSLPVLLRFRWGRIADSSRHPQPRPSLHQVWHIRASMFNQDQPHDSRMSPLYCRVKPRLCHHAVSTMGRHGRGIASTWGKFTEFYWFYGSFLLAKKSPFLQNLLWTDWMYGSLQTADV